MTIQQLSKLKYEVIKMTAKELFFNQYHYLIDGLDDLGYDLINQFITNDYEFMHQYQLLNVIYKRGEPSRVYKVLILVVQNIKTKSKFVLKLSHKLQTFSSSLSIYEKKLIEKEYTLHQTAQHVDPQHVLTIYNHWILKYQTKNKIHYYLVMLLEKGIPLDKLYKNDTILKRHDFQEIVIRFYLDALNTLIKFQKNKILHRDVKPDNIYLANGRVKIGDFDCSKKSIDSTQYQTTVVTPLYGAPEVYCTDKPARYGFKSQVFSLAVAIGVTINRGNLIGVDSITSQEILDDYSKFNLYNLNKFSPKFTYRPLLNKQDPLNDILIKGLRYNPKKRLSMNEFEKQLSYYINKKKSPFNFKLIYLVIIFLLLLLFSL